jgi:hypothetical protein
MSIMEDLNVELWKNAKTLSEIGELTARWIEGTLPFHPCYGENPDEETDSIQKHLINFNRNGLVTTFSQPAESLNEEGYAQRAALEGFTEEDTAKKIAALGLYTDLLVFVYPPEVKWGYQIPISLQEFRPFTWVGPRWEFEEGLGCFTEYCSEEAMKSLKASWQVVVIDLQWGREDHLWQLVNTALTEILDKPFSVNSAHANEGIEEFVY